MLDLTIVIPNYNTCDMVLDCLKSISSSVPKPSYEVIVVDNGSSDGSVESFRKLKNSKLKIISNNENLGFSKACNLGIKVARGKYILLLNSDTLVQKNALDELVKFAKVTPDAGVVGSRLLNKDGSIQPSCFNFPTLGKTILQYWFGQKELLDKLAPAGDKPVEVDAVVGASFLITPQALKKVGKLDPRYFMFYEDLDYCRKVKSKGLKIYYLPKSNVVHYHGQSGKNIADYENQWRRLIPSSKIYFGEVNHALISFVIWSATKTKKLLGIK